MSISVLSEYMYMYHVAVWCSERLGEDMGSLGTVVMGAYKLHHVDVRN